MTHGSSAEGREDVSHLRQRHHPSIQIICIKYWISYLIE